MADTSARTLRLLGLLQHHRFWPGDELAGRLEISPRTLRRDIDRLRTLGYPVSSSPGVEGGYQLEPGATMPPLLLDNDEATALVVGLQAAAHGPVAGIADSSVRALSKVMQILPDEVRRDVDAVHAMTVTSSLPNNDTAMTAHTLATVARACSDEVRLRFAYTARDGKATDRTVEPYRIVTIGRRFYLLAFDMDRADWRTFRLDRLREPDPARNRFDPRPLPSDDIASYVQDRIHQVSWTHQVDVLIHAPAETVEPRVGRWADVEPVGPDRCRLTMTTEWLDWPASLLAALGAKFEVNGPNQLTDLLGAWATNITASLDPVTTAR